MLPPQENPDAHRKSCQTQSCPKQICQCSDNVCTCLSKWSLQLSVIYTLSYKLFMQITCKFNIKKNPPAFKVIHINIHISSLYCHGMQMSWLKHNAAEGPQSTRLVATTGVAAPALPPAPPPATSSVPSFLLLQSGQACLNSSLQFI